ncbi:MULTISPECIES: group II truncated hemoglobin [unclassified Sphingomonas]|uniref:group II truncated hemoglobin n=1 Tax=unclassified Sphingomonas TaxID=196159 RepID=UPI0006F76B6F|nr:MULTISPECIES: group II truncated hemoglobin [unclassified Sphingomonas]KQX26350.1 globin [Sphingomonas sp. Root1294]KQY69420.1 globin [Sphingomonas sp. Root50]KRB89831.1 globin [Sphingomonas sp. Root720]
MADGGIGTGKSAYDRIGGAAVVRSIVDRFYDLMDGDGRFAALRALHGPDLEPMRRSLAGFLAAWLGGPRDWFADNPGKCVMSLHGAIAVSPATARQWADAMRLAIADAAGSRDAGDPDLGRQMADALEGMALAMVRVEPVGG